MLNGYDVHIRLAAIGGRDVRAFIMRDIASYEQPSGVNCSPRHIDEPIRGNVGRGTIPPVRPAKVLLLRFFWNSCRAFNRDAVRGWFDRDCTGACLSAKACRDRHVLIRLDSANVQQTVRRDSGVRRDGVPPVRVNILCRVIPVGSNAVVLPT